MLIDVLTRTPCCSPTRPKLIECVPLWPMKPTSPLWTEAYVGRAMDGPGVDYVELTLDASEDPPVVLGRTSLSRGRRAVTRERPVRSGAAPDSITDEDVADFVLSEVTSLIER